METVRVFYCLVDKRGLGRSDYAALLHNRAWRLVEYVLGSYYGIQHYNVVKSDRGKPFLEGLDIQLSIAHCEGMVVAAFSNIALGIDCEDCNRLLSAGVAKRYLFEGAGIIDWTCYEAYGKLKGTGIPYDYNEYINSDAVFLHIPIEGYVVTVCCLQQVQHSIVMVDEKTMLDGNK